MKTIKGDLIKLAEEGEFNMIVQGCDCDRIKEDIGYILDNISFD